MVTWVVSVDSCRIFSYSVWHAVFPVLRSAEFVWIVHHTGKNTQNADQGKINADHEKPSTIQNIALEKIIVSNQPSICQKHHYHTTSTGSVKHI